MIIVVNGHFKSASTRLFCALLELFNQAVPAQYSSSSHKRNPDLIRHFEFFYSLPSDYHTVAKIHIYDTKLIQRLKSHGCLFVFTERNLFDTAISHKYHYEKENLLKLSFFRYLLGVGLVKLIEQRIYKFYAKSFSDYIFSYRQVMDDTVSVLSFLNHDLMLGYTDAQIFNAASSSDLKGQDINIILGNSDDREWFTMRPSCDVSCLDSLLISFFLFLSFLAAFALICFGLDKALISLRHNVYWSMLRS